MPVMCKRLLAAILTLGACGPEAKEELTDASWVLGRYAHGEGCTSMSADEQGNPVTRGWIVDCTTGRYAVVEFFADGRVRSEFFRCHEDGVPYMIEESRWRATPQEGEVIVEPEGEDLDLIFPDIGIESAIVQRTDDCSQIYVQENDDDEPAYAILHRGEFQWVDLLPSDGCEETAQPVSVPECPTDEDG
jgi:hypothetical protein